MFGWHVAVLTPADKLGIAGFAIACVSLFWQAWSWFFETRVRLRVKLFPAKHRPQILVAECVNKSHRRAVQVRQVWVQWGKDRDDGIELGADLWSQSDGDTPPGRIFQAKAPIDDLHARGMPTLPVKAQAYVRLGTRDRPYRSRPKVLR